MYRYRVTLDKPLAAAHDHSLRSRIFYVDEAITEFALAYADGAVNEVTLVTDEPVEHGELTRKLRLLIEDQIRAMRTVPAQEVWHSPYACAPENDVFEQMVESGAVAELGEGQFCLDESFLLVMDYLDNRFREMARKDLGGREYRYPTLLSVDTLRRTGYLSSFPHFVMLVTRLHSDVDVYSAFLDEESAGPVDDGGLLRYCRSADYCVPPTMCFHTYQQWRGRTIGDMVVTSRGKSFRFESRYRRSLERLWDFTIREIVFLGRREYVLSRREKLMERVFELLTELQMPGHCEAASDPFFSGASTAQRTISQRMLALKYELRLPVAPDRTIAAASFNFHEQVFANAFDLRHTDEMPMYTGCAGFGLERFTYAFLCQHGLNPASWPTPVREHYEAMHT